MTESELYDYGLFRIRQQLSTVAGTLLPTPYGGVVRQIMVDLDQDALNANGLSPIDISNAINAQNVTLPSGTVKIGEREYTVSTNSSPLDFSLLNNVPVKYRKWRYRFHARRGSCARRLRGARRTSFARMGSRQCC